MDYTITTSELARQAGVTQPTIRLYANRGWLDFVIISNGIRLFKPGQAPRVRALYTERMKRRGRPLPAA
jgi:DNA-binding transcriptional MerR regulator